MEQITWNGRILSYIIQDTLTHSQTVFPTPADLELQVGFVVHPAGETVVPHRHVPVSRHIERTCEVILVRRGRCHVDFYNEEGELVASRELTPGALVIMVNGGHGFRMHEDTVLLEVKQGPYFGEREKELLK